MDSQTQTRLSLSSHRRGRVHGRVAVLIVRLFFEITKLQVDYKIASQQVCHQPVWARPWDILEWAGKGTYRSRLIHLWLLRPLWTPELGPVTEELPRLSLEPGAQGSGPWEMRFSPHSLPRHFLSKSPFT